MGILDVMPVVLVFLVLYFLVIRPSPEAPGNRWTFRYRDRTFEVRDFWFREVVSSDGIDPQATAASVTRDEDPRVGAARVLLADIGAVDAEAGAELERALRRVVAAEQAARVAAEAHAVLGGSTDDTSAVVADRAAAVEEMLSSLRALHLRVASAPDDSDELLAGVRDVAARVAATTEVAAVRQRDAARRVERARQSS